MQYKRRMEGERKESDSLDMGSAVDCLLTGSEEDFHKQFNIFTANKPSSDMMLAYVNTLIETEDHEQALIASGYKADPTIVAKTSKDGLRIL